MIGIYIVLTVAALVPLYWADHIRAQRAGRPTLWDLRSRRAYDVWKAKQR